MWNRVNTTTVPGVVDGFPPSCKAGAANRIACVRFDIIYGMTHIKGFLFRYCGPALGFAGIARRL